MCVCVCVYIYIYIYMHTALNASVIDDLAYKKQKKFHNLEDIEGELNFLDRNYWSVVR